ncbi:MAG: hypothetical protein ACRENP_11310 [Longimicrobiales bacterium]
MVARGSAQLRPLEPVDWDAYFESAPIRLHARVGWIDGQRASLAGTVGRLVELGELRMYIRTGAVLLEFAGTPQRLFSDDEVFASPAGGALPAPPDGERHDAGDYRVATVVRLNARASAWLAALRFGTRLPTTNNRVGLDRDQTDFFALLGTHHRRDRWRLGLELGLGINGTRSPTFEQSDVLLYAGTLEFVSRSITPRLTIVGQDDLSARQLRGNEDLAELRAGLRMGRRRWVELALVRGLSTFSPRVGLLLGGGATLSWR